LDIKQWLLKCAELDMRNEMRDLEKAKELYIGGMATPNMNAKFFGLEPRAAGMGGDDYIPAPYAPGKPQEGAPLPEDTGIAPFTVVPDAVAKARAWTTEVRELAALRKRVESLIPQEAVS
jgi:hypothetical protein